MYKRQIYICADCGHTKEDHYWNGGGHLDRSGYDRCRAKNCECVSENWLIKKQKEENKAFKDFFTTKIHQAVAEERERVVGLIEEIRGMEGVSNQALDYLQDRIEKDILSALDKPLTDGEK